MEQKNILVVGINDFNRYELTQIDNPERYNFIYKFEIDEIQHEDHVDVPGILKELRDTVDNYDGTIHGVISCFDFPFSLASFLISDEYNLPGPTLISGIRSEHKYWSRLIQKEVAPEYVPKFQAINPYEPVAFEDLEVSTPFWLKPVKAHSSKLGFKIESVDDYNKAIKETQEKIKHFSGPCNYILDMVDMPDDVNPVDANFCLAEEAATGIQCSVSGYVYDGEVVNYGVVDSLNYERAPSFLCYALPSTLPKEAQDRMLDITEKVIKAKGFNNAPYHMEFFYDQEKDDIKILEINPRISQSHAFIYDMVRGRSNHQVLIQLALGEDPDFDSKDGKYEHAAKFEYRVFEDGVVKNLPDEDRINEIRKEQNECIINLGVKEGDRLSEEDLNDAFSYCLGDIMVSANSRDDLFKEYDAIVEKMGVEIEK